MTNVEYLATQQRLTLMGELLQGEDLAAFTEMLSRADTIGAIMDPTAYRLAMDRLERLRRLAAAAREMQRAFADLKTLVAKEESSPSLMAQINAVRGRGGRRLAEQPPARPELGEYEEVT